MSKSSTRRLGPSHVGNGYEPRSPKIISYGREAADESRLQGA